MEGLTPTATDAALAATTRTHFNVTVHARDIGYDAPILLERPDGRVLRCFDIDFGSARTKISTRTREEEKLRRATKKSTWATKYLTSSAVWLEVTPGVENFKVSLAENGDLVDIADIRDSKWGSYEDNITSPGC